MFQPAVKPPYFEWSTKHLAHFGGTVRQLKA